MNKYEKALREFFEFKLTEKEKAINFNILNELVEKEKPKKVIYERENDLDWSLCPCCNSDIEQYLYDEFENEFVIERCFNCGQKLEWEEQ